MEWTRIKLFLREATKKVFFSRQATKKSGPAFTPSLSLPLVAGPIKKELFCGFPNELLILYVPVLSMSSKHGYLVAWFIN